nr:uncharacterized protein LOC117219580 [Megalopta genalis]XP_033324718.1 uncharacterized protein LOC117219580 [Megalopta genalis]
MNVKDHNSVHLEQEVEFPTVRGLPIHVLLEAMCPCRRSLLEFLMNRDSLLAEIEKSKKLIRKYSSFRHHRPERVLMRARYLQLLRTFRDRDRDQDRCRNVCAERCRLTDDEETESLTDDEETESLTDDEETESLTDDDGIGRLSDYEETDSLTDNDDVPIRLTDDEETISVIDEDEIHEI